MRALTFLEKVFFGWIDWWVGGWLFFLQAISQDWEGLRMSSLAQRWRLVQRWWAHLDFWKKFFNCGRICKNANNKPKNGKKEHILLHALRQKPQIVELRKWLEDDARTFRFLISLAMSTLTPWCKSSSIVFCQSSVIYSLLDGWTRLHAVASIQLQHCWTDLKFVHALDGRISLDIGLPKLQAQQLHEEECYRRMYELWSWPGHGKAV